MNALWLDSQPEPRAHRFCHDAMACTWELYLTSVEEEYAHHVAGTCFEEIDRLEQELSRFVPESDIARLNAAPTGCALPLGPDAFACLELANLARRVTGGAFDVTAGDRPSAANPLLLNRTRHSATLLTDGVSVDLGGIGKGYAIDQVVPLLRAWDIDAAVIHAGQSTLFALGVPAPSTRWQVSLRHPRDRHRTLKRISLCDHALSGSGSWFHGPHIIDPRRGQPATGVLGTWCVASSAALADALSTAFLILTPEEVRATCRRLAVTGFVCDQDRDRTRLARFDAGEE